MTFIQVNELEAKLQKLTNEFEKATEEKNVLIENSKHTERQLVMAERLVNGLSNEKVRINVHISLMQLTGPVGREH